MDVDVQRIKHRWPSLVQDFKQTLCHIKWVQEGMPARDSKKSPAGQGPAGLKEPVHPAPPSHSYCTTTLPVMYGCTPHW